MVTLELRWSKTKLYLYLAGSCAFVAGSILADLQWWERALAAVIGVVGSVALALRLQRQTQPVLVISPEGVQDSRLTPSLMPWSTIEAVQFEPKYFRGGAILVDLHAGLPTPTVNASLFTTRGHSPTAQEGRVRLPLYDLSFDSGAVRQALEATRAT